MSIKVELDVLARALADYEYAYLMTIGSDGRPRAVAVTPYAEGHTLRIVEPGRRTHANALERPAVALVYPPKQVGGYSLIIDGEAAADGDTLIIAVSSAVLHRAATPGSAPSASGCAADCERIEVEATR